MQLHLEAAIERMGSREMYVEIARAFADALPDTEKSITAAVTAGTWAEGRRLAHSLKSNCAAMGADQLRETVYALEKACAAEDEAVARALLLAVRDGIRGLRAALLAL